MQPSLFINLNKQRTKYRHVMLHTSELNRDRITIRDHNTGKLYRLNIWIF